MYSGKFKNLSLEILDKSENLAIEMMKNTRKLAIPVFSSLVSAQGSN